jgi:hypothetical protein
VRIEQDAPLCADQAPRSGRYGVMLQLYSRRGLLMEEQCESMHRRNEWFDWLQNDEYYLNECVKFCERLWLKIPRSRPCEHINQFLKTGLEFFT